jgi:hypothetical protein
MSGSKEWFNIGLIKVGKSGNNYMALGTPKSKYKPVNIELVVKDLEGKVLTTVTNPTLNVSDPRKRGGLTEEQLGNIPTWVKAEISLPPAKE